MSLRALHVLESLAPGGMETTFLNMLRAFRTFDPECVHHVLAFGGGALERAYREAADATVITADSATLERVLSGPYDLVHLLFERCAYRLLPFLLARTTTPVVYSKGYDMGGMYRLNEGLDWGADESMLAAVSGVTFTTSCLAGGYTLPPGRTTVLRKAADVASFAALPEVDARTPMRIACIANLHPRKRIGDLIAALVQVRRHVPAAEVRLVGGGNPDESSRLAALVRAAALPEAVSFAGISENVPTEIAQARIVALPSSCEGVPTVLLEAMAAGRPVVATRVGHVESIIENGVEGFLIDPGDVDALADRLIRLLVDPAAAACMGAAGRVRAARHDVRQVARDLFEALRQAASNASPPHVVEAPVHLAG